MISVSKSGQTWTFTLDSSPSGQSLYLYNSAATTSNGYILRVDADGSYIPLAGGSSAVNNLQVTGNLTVAGSSTLGSVMANSNITISPAGTAGSYGSSGALQIESYNGGTQIWSILGDQSQNLLFEYNGTPYLKANNSGLLYATAITGISTDLILQTAATNGKILFKNSTGSTTNVSIDNSGNVVINNGSITMGSSTYGAGGANIAGSLSAQSTSLTTLSANSANLGASTVSGNLTIVPGGTATSSTSYPSAGHLQIESSVWNGSAAVTNHWDFGTDATSQLSLSYNGTSQLSFNTSGVATFAQPPIFSGAAIQSATIPGSALQVACPPVYTNTGTALGSTVHIVTGSASVPTNGSGTGSVVISLSSSAQFSSGLSYSIAVNVSNGAPGTLSCTSKSGSGFTIAIVGSTASVSIPVDWIAIGS